MSSGRKRSEASRLAILEATRFLLAAVGYERLTIEGIAGRAGVGKQTVYRWWGSKSAVVAEAALSGGLSQQVEPLPDTGHIANDLREWSRAWVARLTSPEGSGLVLALTAATVDNQEVADRLYRHFTEPHETSLLQRLASAQRAGQIDSDADLPTVASTLVGSLLYRVLARQRPPTADDANALVALVLKGCAPQHEGADAVRR
ncbi:TetR/AcrR family transcriptional regulator [Acrocarpospora macrocephala]|uniref:TetR family transcriptional regulator n=1 Tax=Acrocarpospora macrocephala TaxID=150177 RepID=A0A5M3X460_9ACTN|nr:TetR/AcrR family transcriptional regulator [Acrocarpospora macrocephala]GES15860.1 TetR family transcriptional regulator [Acrocarpospora macrocephala]